MTAWIRRVPRWRWIAVAAVLVGGLAVAIVRANHDVPEVLASLKNQSISSPISADDGWVYMLITGSDSESTPALGRVRQGNELEYLDVSLGECGTDSEIQGLFEIAGRTVGLVVSCYTSGPGVSAFVSYSLDTRSSSVLLTFRYEGGPAVWHANSSVGFGRSSSCAPTGGTARYSKSDTTCISEATPEFLTATGNGSLLVLANRCADDAERASTISALCELDPVRRNFRELFGGLSNARGVGSMRGGSDVVLAADTPSGRGIWLLSGNGAKRIAEGEYYSPVFSSDNRFVVAIQRSEGWFSDTSNLVAIPLG